MEHSEELQALLKMGEFSGRYNGKDNSGKPKSDYLLKLIAMTDEELQKECESKIWLSSYAANNPRSDFHFHCDGCYDECQRRGKEEIYRKAHKACMY